MPGYLTNYLVLMDVIIIFYIVFCIYHISFSENVIQKTISMSQWPSTPYQVCTVLPGYILPSFNLVFYRITLPDTKKLVSTISRCSLQCQNETFLPCVYSSIFHVLTLSSCLYFVRFSWYSLFNILCF
jgi:hypothetical protein